MLRVFPDETHVDADGFGSSVLGLQFWVRRNHFDKGKKIGHNFAIKERQTERKYEQLRPKYQRLHCSQNCFVAAFNRLFCWRPLLKKLSGRFGPSLLRTCWNDNTFCHLRESQSMAIHALSSLGQYFRKVVPQLWHKRCWVCGFFSSPRYPHPD